MLELYHNINSVCAQKVRIALAEKGQKVTEHLLTLRETHRLNGIPAVPFEVSPLASPAPHA